MINAENIWNVIAWYFGNNVVIAFLLILMALYLLGRKKENRLYVIGSVIAAFLLFNPLTYRVVTKLGEGNTYYRFLWMIPLSLILAWMLLRIWGKLQSAMTKLIFIIAVIFVIFIYSNSSIENWTTLPESVYQLSDDKIQVADLISEVTDNQPAIVYGEDDLLYGIREYNANICRVTEGDAGYLYHIITENDANASGQLMRAILVNSKIDYVAVNNTFQGAQAALAGAGCKWSGETDHYALYDTDWEQMAADLYRLYNQDWNTDANVCGVESVMMNGIEKEQQLLLYGDGRLDEFDNLTGEQRTVLTGKDAFECQEYEQYIICRLDNRNASISEEIYRKLQEENEKGKQVLLLLSKPLTKDDKDMIMNENSNIAMVIAGNADEGRREMLNETIPQLSATIGGENDALLIQVRER